MRTKFKAILTILAVIIIIFSMIMIPWTDNNYYFIGLSCQVILSFIIICYLWFEADNLAEKNKESFITLFKTFTDIYDMEVYEYKNRYKLSYEMTKHVDYTCVLNQIKVINDKFFSTYEPKILCNISYTENEENKVYTVNASNYERSLSNVNAWSSNMSRSFDIDDIENIKTVINKIEKENEIKCCKITYTFTMPGSYNQI